MNTPAPRVSLFGIQIDALRMPAAVARVYEWIHQPARRCEYVVTPNVDHTVILQSNSALRAAYEQAGLVLADGFPVVWASRFVRRPLPETVTGSDLVPALFDAAAEQGGVRVFLLGAAPGVALIAAARIMERWPAVTVVGTYSPPLGFERDDAENARIVEMVNAAEPHLLVIGFGAPKQELWIARHAAQLRVPAALCVGATIDFLAGEKARAPVWMRRLRLEWLHRLCSEPRRLAKRYARDAWVFPQLVWREWRTLSH
ncbi:MAG TPA: WecB/TagA/CpsF family glycosyltransferase [Pirellulaceae bacterium]|nr:WecB/TagA/CpsF family glycosyltransferase [Pirellulaceae bacterium]